MGRRGWVGLTVVGVLALSCLPARADTVTASSAVELIMDASGSMRGDAGGGQTKLAAAKDALRALISELPDGSQVGLRVYGHRVPREEGAQAGCEDTELVTPIGPVDREQLTEAVGQFKAVGYTPIGRSLRAAARDLADVESEQRTVVLVSDGIDTCAPPQACRVAEELAAQGIGLTVETVGFQVDAEARAELECIAEATGGTYHDAADAGALRDQLVDVSTRAVRAYQTQGEQVQGGASYQEAPVLAPGTYSDTILAREQLWYAVELAQGQQLTARSTLVIGDGDFGGIGALFEVQLYDPLQEAMCCDQERGYEVNIGIGNPARSVSVAARANEVGEAGTYYVQVSAAGEGEAEYPLELTIETSGGASPTSEAATTSATPSAAPSAAAAPTAATTPGPVAPTAASGGMPGWAWVVIALLSVLVALLGVGLALLWRRLNASGPSG